MRALWLRLTARFRYTPPHLTALVSCTHAVWGPCKWQKGPLGYQRYQVCTVCGLYRVC